MMKKYRKKPVVVEATQLSRVDADAILKEIGKNNVGVYNLGMFEENPCFIEIKTLEGTVTANEGDWVIKGINGEFYPCKPDIFEKTYEAYSDVEKGDSI